MMHSSPMTVQNSSCEPSIKADNTAPLSLDQAKEKITRLVRPQSSHEQVSLTAALGRVLAQDVISPIDVPAHDNAAMDGYAFASLGDCAPEGRTLRIVGCALAGAAFLGQVNSGECVRITTGAVMPAGCDSVVPYEQLLAQNDTHITLPANADSAGVHRRLRGEDLQRGSTALHKGRLLTPSDLGLLASLGLTSVVVKTRLRVAFFSTGDEIRAQGEANQHGCVYDSNRYTLFGMLSRLGCVAIDLGIIPDDAVQLETAFRSACEQADVIITSGGVSQGSADLTRLTMSRLGEVSFWQIAMRPGRPMAFGRIHNGTRSALLFGLPGNPVAVMSSFYFLVRPALLRMMGADLVEPLLIPAVTMTALQKKAGRTEFQRGILKRNLQGHLEVSVTGSQGSGILRSMSEANCMIVLHHHQDQVHAGEVVDVTLFDGLI
ncbi:gephyrin-like molybdotransferase Glp [Undibacterium rugosum]|uniref:molybdopterin molybdotransferase MoeA n=1 Tax=Undibacterium rugosum TaxID=2762291 RepID=UPI001E36018B|nr:gephyrin-like molybdotransferase Glp [Undibacterium rugosum]